MAAPPVYDFDGAFQHGGERRQHVAGCALAHGAVAAEAAHEEPAAARLPSNCARANSFRRVYNVRRGERP
jgi:hypothetical protein